MPRSHTPYGKHIVNRLPLLLLSCVVATLLGSAAAVADILRVVDGDTIVVGGVTHRIHGIDAPEFGQTCKTASGKEWACGKAALAEMEKLMLSAKRVDCDNRGQDGYGRQLSVCSADGKDVGKRLVDEGLAWSFKKYSHDYDADEEAARRRGIGIWQAETEAPWDFRSDKWKSAVQSVPDRRCPIKGNINDKGERIYHAPWSLWYSKTKVNTNQGERWFCDEAEAVAAGWRAPYWGSRR